MLKKHVYGCACCSPEFGKIFQGNQNISNMSATKPSDVVADANGSLRVGTSNRRQFLKSGVALVGVTGLLPWLAGAQAAGEIPIVFTGGTILTVDSEFSEAEAIALRGNKILAVGTNAEVRAAAGENANFVELDGWTILPGFIDPHTHVVAGSVVDSVMEYVGMARFSTVAEVLDHLSAMAKERPPGNWIVVRNFDPSVQSGPDALTFSELDAISTKHPIFMLNASGHLAYANSTAFKVAGIPANVEDPPGAEFVRNEGGELTGVMKNNTSFLQILSKYPALSEANPTEALIGLLAKWSQFGLTTVSELALGGLSQSPSDVTVMFDAARSGKLAARIRAYPFYTIGAKTWADAGVKSGDGNALARIAGYKLVADGSNQGFSGLQRES
jgi:predicted amidohydrolase YtcJ